MAVSVSGIADGDTLQSGWRVNTDDDGNPIAHSTTLNAAAIRDEACTYMARYTANPGQDAIGEIRFSVSKSHKESPKTAIKQPFF